MLSNVRLKASSTRSTRSHAKRKMVFTNRVTSTTISEHLTDNKGKGTHISDNATSPFCIIQARTRHAVVVLPWFRL
jgi:hypothetical protein